MNFQEINISELNLNPFTKISKEWLLITSGDAKHCNTMTASWGGMGVIWNKNVVTTYIRPQRYTKEFVDRNDLFTLSFLNEKYRDALTLCGKVSGRDADKIKDAGLTLYELDETVAFTEADMILVCKKLYSDTIRPTAFLDPELDPKNYPAKDYHSVYIAEIVRVMVKIP